MEGLGAGRYLLTGSCELRIEQVFLSLRYLKLRQ